MQSQQQVLAMIYLSIDGQLSKQSAFSACGERQCVQTRSAAAQRRQQEQQPQ
jgi:hypothetical protein